MVNSRAKGHNFENEIKHALFSELGLKFQRDLNQYRQSDLGDLLCDDPSWPFVIECKRYAAGCQVKVAWLEQARRAARAVELYPAVIYKYNHQPIRVSIPFAALAEALGGTCDEPEQADLSFFGFCFVARELMSVRAGE